MIKRVGYAIKHPTNRSLDDFQTYWATKHGPFFAHTPGVRRYVQHITLKDSYGGALAPTHDGVSMFFYDDLEAALNPPPSPKMASVVPEAHKEIYDWYVASKRYGDPWQMTMQETVGADDRQLFDRRTDWPTAHRKAQTVSTEVPVIDAIQTPEMVKAVIAVARRPGLTVAEFQEHFLGRQAELVAKVPGLRRYVQNPAAIEAYGLTTRPMTHDAFSELWFDDLESLERAVASSEWKAAAEDGEQLFAAPAAVVIAREGIRKEIGFEGPVEYSGR